MTVCKWCYGHSIEYAEEHLTWHKEDPEAIKWLGIPKKEICRGCRNSIVNESIYVTQNFIKRLTLNENGWNQMDYWKLPIDIKRLVWVWWLYNHLREHITGRYFKIRMAKV